MTKNNFAGVDFLRCFAALLVCGFHIAFMSQTAPASSAALISGQHFNYAEGYALTSVGWVGVQIFFVISGFVITFSASGSAWSFLRSRILRLYPAVWICAPFSLVIALAFGGFAPTEALSRMARSMVLWPKGNWVDGVYWTLGIEMSFYLVVFLLLCLRSRHLLTLLLVVLGCLSASYWLANAATLAVWGVALIPEHVLAGAFQRYFELSLLPHGLYFAIGGLICAILCEGASRRLWLAIGFFAVGAMAEIQATALVQAANTATTAHPLFAQLIWSVSMVLVTLSIVKRDAFANMLGGVNSRLIGNLTYPLYLLHTTVGCAVLRLCSTFGTDRWSALIAALISALAASYGVAKYLEPKLRHRLAKLMDVMVVAAVRGEAVVAKLDSSFSGVHTKKQRQSIIKANCCHCMIKKARDSSEVVQLHKILHI